MHESGNEKFLSSKKNLNETPFSAPENKTTELTDEEFFHPWMFHFRQYGDKTILVSKKERIGSDDWLFSDIVLTKEGELKLETKDSRNNDKPLEKRHDLGEEESTQIILEVVNDLKSKIEKHNTLPEHERSDHDSYQVQEYTKQLELLTGFLDKRIAQ